EGQWHHAVHVDDPHPRLKHWRLKHWRLKHWRDGLQCARKGPDNGPAEGDPRHMRYWLVKSEPDSFSWDQQVANGVEPWTGVRNHTAKLNLKAMKQGDLAFFYHSNIGKEIVGVVEVAREAYPDPTAEKGDWVSVDMKAVSPVPK